MIAEALWARLQAVAGVTALVSARVYPLLLRQNPTYPAVTYEKVSGPRIENLQGLSGLAHPRFQFSCFGDDYEEADSVAEQVRLALEGYRAIIFQNFLTRSEEMDDADWTKTLGTVSADSQTAPDGTLTADRVTPTSYCLLR